MAGRDVVAAAPGTAASADDYASSSSASAPSSSSSQGGCCSSSSVIVATVITGLTALLSMVLQFADPIEPIHRGFYLNDPAINHPHEDYEVVSSPLLVFLSLVLPGLVFALQGVWLYHQARSQLRLRMGEPSRITSVADLEAPVPGASYLGAPDALRSPSLLASPTERFFQAEHQRDRLFRLHLAAAYLGLLSLVFGWFLTNLITNSVKLMAGKLRPDFVSRCDPDLALLGIMGSAGPLPNVAIDSPLFFVGPNGQDRVCRGEADYVRQGRYSLPSGHSSSIWFGTVFLVLALDWGFARLALGARALLARHRAAFLTSSANNNSNRYALAGVPGMGYRPPHVYPPARFADPAPWSNFYGNTGGSGGSHSNTGLRVLEPRMLMVKPLLQAVVVSIGAWVTVTRLSDRMHDGWDVLVGLAIGAGVAYAVFRAFAETVRDESVIRYFWLPQLGKGPDDESASGFGGDCEDPEDSTSQAHHHGRGRYYTYRDHHRNHHRRHRLAPSDQLSPISNYEPDCGSEMGGYDMVDPDGSNGGLGSPKHASHVHNNPHHNHNNNLNNQNNHTGDAVELGRVRLVTTGLAGVRGAGPAPTPLVVQIHPSHTPGSPATPPYTTPVPPGRTPAPPGQGQGPSYHGHIQGIPEPNPNPVQAQNQDQGHGAAIMVPSTAATPQPPRDDGDEAKAPLVSHVAPQPPQPQPPSENTITVAPAAPVAPVPPANSASHAPSAPGASSASAQNASAAPVAPVPPTAHAPVPPAAASTGSASNVAAVPPGAAAPSAPSAAVSSGPAAPAAFASVPAATAPSADPEMDSDSACGSAAAEPPRSDSGSGNGDGEREDSEDGFVVVPAAAP